MFNTVRIAIRVRVHTLWIDIDRLRFGQLQGQGEHETMHSSSVDQRTTRSVAPEKKYFVHQYEYTLLRPVNAACSSSEAPRTTSCHPTNYPSSFLKFLNSYLAKPHSRPPLPFEVQPSAVFGRGGAGPPGLPQHRDSRKWVVQERKTSPDSATRTQAGFIIIVVTTAAAEHASIYVKASRERRGSTGTYEGNLAGKLTWGVT